MPSSRITRLNAIKKLIAQKFNKAHWIDLGIETDSAQTINGHERLLRSLHWNDPDYEEQVSEVISYIVSRDSANLEKIENFLTETFDSNIISLPSQSGGRRISFVPSVFRVPEGGIEDDLVAVMMPFGAQFSPVLETFRQSCRAANLRCLRADDVWRESEIINDIFSLIFRARIVIVDFSGRNPNVMYETGIAHTLGKTVLPVAQAIDDIPSDMRQHRALLYLPNGEGLNDLKERLTEKLRAELAR
jgi:hypothetical protein